MDRPAPAPLLIALRKCGQLTDAQLGALERIWAECEKDPPRLASNLRGAEILTTYQYRKMHIGRAADLLFGKYLIFDKIGEGGMGKVYRAADTNMSRLVALKVVRPQLLANKTVLKRYRREAQATATLDHPNIVHLYDADETAGRHYMAMEYVDGSDLSRLVRDNGPLGYAEACEYIRQAALGLHHAHEKGFIHRDIKPSNLLVYGERALEGSGGRAMVKILDMGLVRSLSEDGDDSLADLTRDNTVVGTPDFMSPEQASDSRSVDGRADLYSLGCAFVYLLTGKPPYQETGTVAKLLAHQRNPIPDLAAIVPGLPAGVVAILTKLLAKKRGSRYATGAELAAALEPFTPDGIRSAIPSPAAALRAGTGTPDLAMLTPPHIVTVQEIAQPKIEWQSSESISLDDEAAPAHPKKRRSGIPVWLMIALGVVGIGVPVATFAIFTRTKPTVPEATATLPARKPPATRLSEPAISQPEYHPLSGLLPSGTAGILVYHPRAFWDAEAPNLPKNVHASLDALAKDYGFDPRWFERGVVAFQPNGAKCVAAGEAAAFNAEWFAEFEKVKGRKVLPADGQGVRSVHYGKLNLFIPKEAQTHGAILPPAHGIGGLLLSDSHVEMNAMIQRLRANAPPGNVAAPLLEAATKAEAAQPHAFFAASGEFRVPRSGLPEAPSLASFGVELFTATFHFEQRWTVEIDIFGPDADKLKDFMQGALPNCFDNSSKAATAIAEKLRVAAAKPQITTDTGGKHLKVTIKLETGTVNGAIEHFLAK